MKKIFAILAVLSLLMVPCVSMAATMTDSDLAAVTGQSGITITLSSMNIDLGLGTFTYGDYDGLTGVTDSTGAQVSQTKAGYVNVAFYPYPMHIGIAGVTTLTIDIGSATHNPAALVQTGGAVVNIGVTMTGAITVDAVVMNIFLDNNNGAAEDYVILNGTPGANVYVHNASGYASAMGVSPVGAGPAYYTGGQLTAASAGIDNCIGVVGISGISVKIPSLNIGIAAH